MMGLQVPFLEVGRIHVWAAMVRAGDTGAWIGEIGHWTYAGAGERERDGSLWDSRDQGPKIDLSAAYAGGVNVGGK
jgi:hypothetical protein